MKLNRLGFFVLGALSVVALGCPVPMDNKPEGSGGAGGGDSSGGSGGSSAKGGSGGSSNGGSGGSSSGGSSGSGGGSGSGGASGSGGGSGSGGSGGSSGSGGSGGSGGSSSTDAKPADMGGGTADMSGGGGIPAAFMGVYTDTLSKKCGCHVMNGAGGLSFSNAMTAYMNLKDKNSTQAMCTTLKRVTPGDPTKSLLVTLIKFAAATGNTAPATGCNRTNRMPKNGAALTAAEITAIEGWITADK
jgi:hypothetical protein